MESIPLAHARNPIDIVFHGHEQFF